MAGPDANDNLADASGVIHDEFVRRRDKALLAELRPQDRELVLQAMANHPALALAKALGMLKAFGL